MTQHRNRPTLEPYVWAFVSLAVILMFAAFTKPDPLNRQERIARAGTVITTTFETAPGDDYYWQALRLQTILTSQLGVHVEFTKLDDDQLGVTTIIGPLRAIGVADYLHWTARYEVLAHEAGHILAPHFNTVAESEVFAEGVLAYVCSHEGDMGAVDRSGRYLRQHKTALHVLTDYRADIERAGEFLLGR